MKKADVIEKEGSKFPGRSFATNILKPIFDTQKCYFLDHFIEMTKAHVVMLLDCKIISHNESVSILMGINNVSKIDFKERDYNPDYEDLFFMFEKELALEIGEDLAGRVHIARSRNDICIAEFRMVLRTEVQSLLEVYHNFRVSMMYVIENNIETIMPAYTHTQPAQPTTLAHYLLAFYDATSRNVNRLYDLEKLINRSPLGAAAITTTGFPISRQKTSNLLGFHEVIENSYDAIAGNDHYLQCSSVITTMSIEIGKLLKDILDLCTNEFSGISLTDPYVQKSSIMPQKRNPSSLEHCRPLVSLALAEAQSIVTVLHNTPYGDIVDSEEDLQPHIYKAFDYLKKVLTVMSNVFVTMKINKDVLELRATKGNITVTELADTLVREEGLSFRSAHHLTAKLVGFMLSNDKLVSDISEEELKQLSYDILGHDTTLDKEKLKKALCPKNFIAVRSVYGGPEYNEVSRMVNDRKKDLEVEIKEIDKIRSKYIQANEMLLDEINHIIGQK